jgi:5-methylcytosine-specific restriction endonuclease McrA
MAKRQREWAKKARLQLELKLGTFCAKCGKTEQLEFDCIIPQGDFHHRRMEWSWRISFYRLQHYTKKNLQLLCVKCHSKKTLEDEQRFPF